MVVLTFPVLDLQVLPKKSIWDFDVTSLISQELNRREFKPVAFLVFLKSNIVFLIYFRWNDNYQLFFLQDVM